MTQIYPLRGPRRVEVNRISLERLAAKYGLTLLISTQRTIFRRRPKTGGVPSRYKALICSKAELIHSLCKLVLHTQSCPLKLFQPKMTDCPVHSHVGIGCHHAPKVNVVDGMDKVGPCCSELRAMAQ